MDSTKIFFLLLWQAWLISSTVISNSKLERCVVDGAVSLQDSQITCEEKLVVTIAIEGGREIETESLKFDLTCIGSSTCPCPCDYAAEADCKCRDLNHSLVVALTKSPVYATYALTYIQAFNSKPKEVVQSGLSSCKDGDFTDSPTCGWYLVNGQRVSDSQGFCCECSSSQVISDTFGSLEERTRANLNCDFFDDAWNFFASNPSSAHCLYLDPLWYQGFEMDTARIEFEIEVQMRDDTSHFNETLRLSPSEPLKINANQSMEVELLGDLANYNALPDLGDKMLMIPFPPGSDPASALSSNQEEWMLIDKSQVSLDGTECNKVGTSFTAFRFQPDGCSRPVGTCLSNQLYDRYSSDLERVSSGQTPLYLISRYSKSSSISQKTSVGAGEVYLQFPVHGIRNSLVTLTAAADNLQFVLHSSPGEILQAAVCSFNNVSCGAFEALTDRGYLHVQIQNTGYISAEYTTTVSNCSDGVMAVEAQRSSLAAQESHWLPAFLIQMTTAVDRTDLSCWVTLRSSLGEELDLKNVSFAVNKTTFTALPENTGLSSESNFAPEPRSLSCADYCPNVFDILCALAKRCWTRLLIAIGLILALFFAGSLFIKGVRNGWFLKCFTSWRKFVWKKEQKMVRKGFEERRILDSAEDHCYSISTNLKHVYKTPKMHHGDWKPFIYVDLSAIGMYPNWLLSPGPSPCLAGQITKIQSIPQTEACHVFVIPEGRNFQKKIWRASERRYTELQHPVPFNSSLAMMILEPSLGVGNRTETHRLVLKEKKMKGVEFYSDDDDFC